MGHIWKRMVNLQNKETFREHPHLPLYPLMDEAE